jgi:hypothetical protein
MDYIALHDTGLHAVEQTKRLSRCVDYQCEQVQDGETDGTPERSATLFTMTRVRRSFWLSVDSWPQAFMAS